MALKGNLRDFSTTQLLNLINLARKTGTLSIENPGEEARIMFKEGKLIFASLGGQYGNLAGMLQKAGRLSTDQARAIQEHGRHISDKELGLMLINKGYVTQNDILFSVRAFILDSVYRVFTWSDGMFRFEANQLPPDDRITVPIDLELVIMEGTRRIKEYERLQDELPELDLALKFTDRPSAVRSVNLTPEEWRVVSYINAQNTIRQIGQVNHLSDFQMRRIVYGLIQAGLVEVIRAPRPDRVPERVPVSRPIVEVAAAAPMRPAVAAAGSQATPTSRLAVATQARPGKGPEAAPTTPPSLAAKAAAPPKRSLVLRLIDRIRGL